MGSQRSVINERVAGRWAVPGSPASSQARPARRTVQYHPTAIQSRAVSLTRGGIFGRQWVLVSGKTCLALPAPCRELGAPSLAILYSAPHIGAHAGGIVQLLFLVPCRSQHFSCLLPIA